MGQEAVLLQRLLAQMEQIRLHFRLLLWVAAVVDHIMAEPQKPVAVAEAGMGLAAMRAQPEQRGKEMPVGMAVLVWVSGVRVAVGVLLVRVLLERL